MGTTERETKLIDREIRTIKNKLPSVLTMDFMPTKKPVNIDEYIDGFPKETQALLEKIRTTIKQAVPEATETISYGMPAFKLNDKAVWFAAFKNHIGLYPMYEIDKFKDEMDMYKGKGTKDTLHFLYDQTLPLELISNIVKYKLWS